MPLGDFNAGAGSVVFDDATQVSDVYGATSFYNLTITTPSKRVNSRRLLYLQFPMILTLMVRRHQLTFL